jgi:hypothetical protein
MPTKVTKRKKNAKPPAKTAVRIEPFAATVEETPLKKRAAANVAPARTIAASPTPEPEKTVEKPALQKPARSKGTAKTPRKPAISETVDPFAQFALDGETKPKKTAPKKTVKKKVAPRKTKKVEKAAEPQPVVAVEATRPEEERSPVFKKLADVQLPELERENRAHLAMQSPTRLYFYWSLKENPWHHLRRIFGDDLGSYTLVVKLIDAETETEEIHPCPPEGNWWFAAEPGREYRAEIGFYATNRPYFRILYSNAVTTPLRTPSPRPATEARWTLSALKFAEVLDASGFRRDAVDVAMAGDDVTAADSAARHALARFTNGTGNVDDVAGSDIRFAMNALAAGARLEELRWEIGERLFAILQANSELLRAATAGSVLTEYFEIDGEEYASSPSSPATFGASLVTFPRRVISTRYRPISSSK